MNRYVSVYAMNMGNKTSGIFKNSNIPKLVLFGAGKIGRSFIGQLFSRSGYEVVFVDISPQIIDALNAKQTYRVFVCDTYSETLLVEHVRGILANDTEKVADEIASADILAISVGKNGLKSIVPTLAQGLIKRESVFPGRMVDVILAENMRNADEYLHDALSKVLPESYPLGERVGFIETSIGKMVPFTAHHDDPLSVSAEAYNTLIVNKEMFKNPIPDVAGLAAKDHIKAWVDRKLFIHNFGHAATAYLGYQYHPDRLYLWEVLEDKKISAYVRGAMQQSAKALQREYPDVFSEDHLQEHIDDLMKRFSNRYLEDTVFRVGCDLYRKLAPDDRVIVPLTSAYYHDLPYDMILKVLGAALQFKATDANSRMFPSDAAFHVELEEKGVRYILQEVCGLSGSDSILFINQLKETDL